MRALSSAARQRRTSEAIIINSKADVESASLLKEAAELLDTKAAMQIRFLETLELMAEVFGTERPACVARELTKTFETFYHGTLPSILARLSGDEDQQKGEFVVMITGHPNPSTAGSLDSEKLLRLLSSELPPKKAAALVAEVTGENKKELYDRLLRMKA